jgi:hypothetical protein
MPPFRPAPEPNEGEVRYEAVFNTLTAVGYRGLLGLQYKPRGRTEDASYGYVWHLARKPNCLTLTAKLTDSRHKSRSSLVSQ